MVASAITDYPSRSLKNFKVINKLETKTFSDVLKDSWYFPGVVISYENGIMKGVGAGKFNPNDQVTLAQAITIASRVHATYYSNIISNQKSDLWYESFYNYAKDNNFLPPSVDSINNLDEIMATRADIAYLFNNVISESDMPKINNSVIPDKDSVPPEYKASVSAMYSSGIITGKNGGIFDPSGLATRSEIATIIMRLIDKIDRVAYDSKFNYDMENQQSNLKNSGIIAYDDKYSYHIAISSFHEWEIIRRDNWSGNIESIFSLEKISNYTIKKLSLYNNNLYFIFVSIDDEKNESTILKKINLDTLEVAEIYGEKNKNITYYTIYDGQIYVGNTFINNNKLYFEIAKVTSASASKNIFSGQGSTESLNCFNGKLYFDHMTDFYEVNLSNNSVKNILTIPSCYTINKNYLYYMDNNGNINKTLLNDLKQKKVLVNIGIENLKTVGFLNNSSNKLYFSKSDENIIFGVPNYTTTDDDKIELCGYTTKPAAHLSIFDDFMFYSNVYATIPSSFRIAGTNSSKQNDISINKWLETNKR